MCDADRNYPAIRADSRDAGGSDVPCEATVDADVLPGDVAGALRGEEADRGGDLVGAAVAAHRHAPPTLLGGRQAVDPAAGSTLFIRTLSAAWMSAKTLA